MSVILYVCVFKKNILYLVHSIMPRIIIAVSIFFSNIASKEERHWNCFKRPTSVPVLLTDSKASDRNKKKRVSGRESCVWVRWLKDLQEIWSDPSFPKSIVMPIFFTHLWWCFRRDPYFHKKHQKTLKLSCGHGKDYWLLDQIGLLIAACPSRLGLETAARSPIFFHRESTVQQMIFKRDG